MAKPSVSGETIVDSFGNTDFYITAADDTLALVAEAYGFSEAKVAGFNGLQPGTVLAPGTRLRLMPDGPGIGASGAAVVDTAGIPTSYTIEHDDTLAGITYRFNVTADQLAEANKVPFVTEQGNVHFVVAGRTIQLQKNPVDSRSGTGQAVENSWGTTVFYTTADGDSFDSLGYQFRVGTAEILQYNPSLVETEPIPAGTKLWMIAGDLPLEGASGTFTADADGIPLTYTTVAGDTEVQVAARFGVTVLADANRPTSGTRGVWYDSTIDGHLAAGQTISVSLDQPINKPGLDS
ncbi:LysM peptidoglycan-binding domain-containing protein [Arthrobacter sp. Z1-15]